MPPEGVDCPDESFQWLVHQLHVTLKTHGFRKNRTNFYRTNDLCTQVIAFTKSSWRVGKDWPLEFYVDIGVAMGVFREDWERVKSAGATDQEWRLEMLAPERYEVWRQWEIKNRLDAERSWERLEPAIVEWLIPALDRTTALSGLVELMRLFPASVPLKTKAWLAQRGVAWDEVAG